MSHLSRYWLLQQELNELKAEFIKVDIWKIFLTQLVRAY